MAPTRRLERRACSSTTPEAKARTARAMTMTTLADACAKWCLYRERMVELTTLA
jgi:hypothetical protein